MKKLKIVFEVLESGDDGKFSPEVTKIAVEKQQMIVDVSTDKRGGLTIDGLARDHLRETFVILDDAQNRGLTAEEKIFLDQIMLDQKVVDEMCVRIGGMLGRDIRNKLREWARKQRQPETAG